MEIFQACKHSRYSLNPGSLFSTLRSLPIYPSFPFPLGSNPSNTTSQPSISAISSSGSPSICKIIASVGSKPSDKASRPAISAICSNGSPSICKINASVGSNSCNYKNCSIRVFSNRFFSNNVDSSYKSFGNSVDDGGFELDDLCGVDLEDSSFRERGFVKFKPHVESADVKCIIDVIKSNGDDMESRLNSLGANLSKYTVIEILSVLNCEKVPALRFFDWIKGVHLKLYRNSDICSLIVDNCGRLGDYDTMCDKLTNFQTEKLCLTDKAFGFLPVLSSEKMVASKSIKGMIDVLNEVGGSCRNSGIHSLLKMLCSLNVFDLAKFVIEMTERKVSYYNILVWGRCTRCEFKEVRKILDEMREMGCDPDAKTYNYLISSLCKHHKTAEASSVLEEMIEKGCPPDALSFEILIYFSCSCGKWDQAVEFFDHMVSRGIEPRFQTHAAFIKGYFNAQQFEEAYKYVVSSVRKHRYMSNRVYCILVSLHQKKGDLLTAYNLLLEMIEKDLKPEFSVLTRVQRRLHRTGRGHLAQILDTKFRNLVHQSSTRAG